MNRQKEKKEHHNALEKKRRDYIKDKFDKLRDTVPTLSATASREKILKKSIDFIKEKQQTNLERRRRNKNLKRQNLALENQISVLEKVISDHHAKLKRQRDPIPDLSDYNDNDEEFSDSEVEYYNLSYN
ncbi:protein max-like [Linepithema humile]|uniref:protein max-like n=1 Tax=Linepithema humile TaxID=83485 RepID=UPI00351E8ED7